MHRPARAWRHRLAIVAVTLAATAGVSPASGVEMRIAACHLSDLATTVGPGVTPATGQHPLSLHLVNRSPKACRLFGYPSIEFRDQAGAIPFRIRHAGDQMVTSRRPGRIVVKPGRAAFVVVNKYRCDLGDLRSARILRLGLPGAPATERRAVGLPHGDIAYCGTGDPGSTVAVSPFVASLREALQS